VFNRIPSLFYSGNAADVIPNLKRDFGVAIVDLMFLDHSASSYVSDVAVASAENFLAAGDNQTTLCDVPVGALKTLRRIPRCC
jgi:hypothetical protein